MSKIEVNTVAPQCGTTLTLGESGDTVALGSGASQTGFGRTGTVDWVTTPKVTGDSPITAVTGKGYFLNTTAGTITINLPAGAAGSIVSMADYAGTWQTNNVTVSPNGSEKIGGIAKSAALAAEGQSVTFVYVDSTQGWLNTMDSTSNVRGNAYMVATGGTITTSGNDKIHTFTGPGTFTVCSVAACAADNLVSYMVVAGGGGGASSSPTSNGGGGGGAGGYRELISPSSPYTGSPLNGYPSAPNRITVTATGYPIGVGGGGAGVTPGGQRASGDNSTFSTITAAGGGGAANRSPMQPYVDALTGGSGGGGAGGSTGPNGALAAGNTPSTTPAQGNPGGANQAVGAGSGTDNPAGAGGGAGGTGGHGTVNTGGIGGAGTTSSINATPTARAGGGGGGGSPNGPSSAGGGSAAAGTVNTGGGGGGNMNGAVGGAGGSGLVIIRYRYQ